MEVARVKHSPSLLPWDDRIAPGMAVPVEDMKENQGFSLLLPRLVYSKIQTRHRTWLTLLALMEENVGTSLVLKSSSIPAWENN